MGMMRFIVWQGKSMDIATTSGLRSEGRPAFRIDVPRLYSRAGESLRPLRAPQGKRHETSEARAYVAVPVRRLLTRERDILKLVSTLFLSID